MCVSVQVKCGDRLQMLPDNPERFDRVVCVLGQEAFSSGRYYWEVRHTHTHYTHTHIYWEVRHTHTHYTHTHIYWEVGQTHTLSQTYLCVKKRCVKVLIWVPEFQQNYLIK